MSTKKRYCGECNKPLGSTEEFCHEHGGENRRAGQPEPHYYWQFELGVPTEKIKKFKPEKRNIDNEEHHTNAS